MSEKIHILIRVEGSSTIGMGHLVRINRITRKLLKRSHCVTVLTNNVSPANSILPDDVTVINGTDPNALENQYDIIVADLPEESNDPEIECMNLGLMQSLADTASTFVVFQELLNRTVCCDVLINNHVYANRSGYDWVGDEPDWLLGGDYVIFNEDIRSKATIPSEWNEQPDRAVITIGGSDTKNVTPNVMRAFQNKGLNVDVIIGPGVPAAQQNQIENTTSVPGATFGIHENPNNFAELLHRADFAVSALGLTTYELFALRTPIIGIKTAPDQAPKATFVQEQDVGLVTKNHTREAVRQEVEIMLNKPNKRRRYRNQAADLVDPYGVNRVVDYLERAVNKRK
jgi:spore coat polysaccharide biosynthesis predicted glycosyltransferase SpsG